MSPLRDCVSQNPGYYTSINPFHKSKSPFVSFGSAPQVGNSLLKVLNQGPNESINPFNNQNSKRQIDFDEIQENNEEDTLIKKRKFSNAIVDKIIEQKNQENKEDEGGCKPNFSEKSFGLENSFGKVKSYKISTNLVQGWPSKNLIENRERKLSFENIDPLFRRTSLFGGELKIDTHILYENENEGNLGTKTPEFGKEKTIS